MTVGTQIVYRKPRRPRPPHVYCHRWCERCSLDRHRCELLSRLPAAVRSGVGPPLSWDHASITAEVRQTLGPVPLGHDRLLVRARRYTFGILALAGEAAVIPLARRHLEVAGLSRCAVVVWARLTRAAAGPHPEGPDAILAAQVAHQCLVETLAALLLLQGKVPGARDLLPLGLGLVESIEQDWLTLPHPDLEPCQGELDRWGPLEVPGS